MSNKDSVGRTFIVAVSLCFVCSVFVSTAVVVLKPDQEKNQLLDKKRNILAAAGMLEADRSIDEQFASVTTKLVDLSSGRFTDEVGVDGFDQRDAAKDPGLSQALDAEEDIAKIKRREKYSLVYLVNDERGEVSKIILPIRGYGLWSTMYGFVALDADFNTISGLGFYEQGETPGLGGEIDNPIWKAKWPGKKVYRDGEVDIALVKGTVDPGSSAADWRVDGLSGATMTSNGVTHLLQFWLGENGFQPFLENLKAGEA